MCLGLPLAAPDGWFLQDACLAHSNLRSVPHALCTTVLLTAERPSICALLPQDRRQQHCLQLR